MIQGILISVRIASQLSFHTHLTSTLEPDICKYVRGLVKAIYSTSPIAFKNPNNIELMFEFIWSSPALRASKIPPFFLHQ